MAQRWPQWETREQLALAYADFRRSDNHNPFNWEVRVRLTPAVLAAYRNWHAGQTMPDDTWLVAEHRDSHDSRPTGYYFAHKANGAWQFGAASPDGWLLPADSRCAQCHFEATADSVFGLPTLTTTLPNEQRPDGG